MTNWKYILIIVILAVIVGGGILHQWRELKEEVKIPEVKIPKKVSEIPKERKEIKEAKDKDITITTSKSHYYTDEIYNHDTDDEDFAYLRPIITNNSGEDIFSRWSKSYGFYFELERYSEDRWETIYNSYLYFDEIDGEWGLKLISNNNDECRLIPQGEIQTSKFGFKAAKLIFKYFIPGKHRYVFYYYEDSFCQGERRNIFSEEFVIEDKNEIAAKFCRENEKEANLLYFYSFLNFDRDLDKEIIVGCHDSFRGLDYLYLLNKEEEQYKAIFIDGYSGGNKSVSVREIKIEDKDNDGIDEIYYKFTEHIFSEFRHYYSEDE